MNIEIANRLVNLRKEKGLSQEQLAEKIGVSRQAVSKWERSEASPDTDNLIMLARLYEISLDELLRTSDEIPVREPEPETPPAPEPEETKTEVPAAEEAETELPAGEAAPEKDSVSADGGGLKFTSKKGGTVSVGSNGLFINGEDYHLKDKLIAAFLKYFPVISVCLLLFIATTFTVLDGIRISWVFIAAVPLYFSLKNAIKLRDPYKFAFPVVAASAFLMPLLCFQPHERIHQYSWLFLLTIPLYYLICYIIKKYPVKSTETGGSRNVTDKEQFSPFRGLLTRRSLIIDSIIVCLDVLLITLISVNDTIRRSYCINFSVIHLAAASLQMTLHSMRDRDIRQLPFGYLLTAAFLIIFPFGDLYGSFTGRGLHWIVFLIPVTNMIADYMHSRKSGKAAEAPAESIETEADAEEKTNEAAAAEEAGESE